MMNYSMLEETSSLAGWSKESEALSIYQALESIEDLRGKQGKGYELALLLICMLLAKMAGETTLQAICEWIRFRKRWLQDVLPSTRATFPCAATYCNVLRGVDPIQVNQVLMDLVTRVRAHKREAAEQEHVVLNGKTLRGTQQHLAADQKKVHHLNLYEAKTGIVLKEARVEEKAGELTHLNLFLPPVLLAGVKAGVQTVKQGTWQLEHKPDVSKMLMR